MNVRQYVYISTAPKMDAREVDRILETSHRNNRRDDISGFLLFNGRNFLQLVEGEAGNLDALMDRIRRDPRHQGIVQISRREIDQRCCHDWSMRQIDISGTPQERRQKLEAQLPPGLSRDARDIALSFAILN
jgi:hypothetical protein